MRAGLEEEEPCPDRTIGVLEPDRDEPHFLTGHFGAGLDREISAGAGVEGRIPGSAEAFTYGPGTEHVHGAAHAGDDRFSLEHVELVLPCAEADRTDTLVSVHERIDNEDSLEDLAACGRDRVLRCLGDDDLVGLAVDHELPPAFVDILALLVFPDLESPLFKEVDCRIHVAGNIVNQVFPGDAHEVLRT